MRSRGRAPRRRGAAVHAGTDADVHGAGFHRLRTLPVSAAQPAGEAQEGDPSTAGWQLVRFSGAASMHRFLALQRYMQIEYLPYLAKHMVRIGSSFFFLF